MKKIDQIIIKVGWMLCFAFIVAPANCQTYPGDPYTRGGLYEETSSSDMSYYMEIRSEVDFYEPLGEYGRWVDVEPYGHCWVPERVDSDWRPYSEGYWVRTDEGWYWESDEPWAWATYHYGRWDWQPDYGWVWVPQIEWAPAWVSWRQGDGYFGWAPLPPSARFARSGYVEFNESDIAPRAFVFVEERRFLEHHHPKTVIVNNTTIIQKTVYMTNMQVVNNTVINEGPRTAVIEHVSGQKVQAAQVRELRRKQESNVVTLQRTKSTGHEKKTRTQVPGEDQARGAKALPTYQPRQTENIAVITSQPKKHSQNQKIQVNQEQKSSATFTQPDKGQQQAPKEMKSETKRHFRDQNVQAVQEQKHAATITQQDKVQQQAPRKMKLETHSEQSRPVIIPAQAKPETRQLTETKGPTEQKTGKHSKKQEKNDQQPDQSGKDQQVTSDQGGGQNTVKKGHNKKGDEQ